MCDFHSNSFKVKVKVAQSCPTLATPWTVQSLGSLSLLQGIFPSPWIELRSPALQADSSPAEPQGNIENTGMDS